jgi:hypothetical protein
MSAVADSVELHARLLVVLGQWKGFQSIQDGLELFEQIEVFAVGGAVRDLLCRRSSAPKDFDFVVAGQGTDDFIDWLGTRGRLGQGAFGSPRWWPPEVGARYADVIPVQRFFNGLWRCRDIVDVLNQFDFTANAVAVGLRSKLVLDPQNGVRDAREKVLRAIRFDYPDEPISEDYSLSRLSVLWIRMVHYASALGFRIEPVTEMWLRAHIHFGRDAGTFADLFFLPDLHTHMN